MGEYGRRILDTTRYWQAENEQLARKSPQPTGKSRESINAGYLHLMRIATRIDLSGKIGQFGVDLIFRDLGPPRL